jgi:hypothetical protein
MQHQPDRIRRGGTSNRHNLQLCHASLRISMTSNRRARAVYLRIRRVLRALAICAIAVLVASCGRVRGGLVFVDQAAALERARVETAATRLNELGVTLAVFSVANGDAAGDDFTRRLDAAGLLRSGKIVPDAIALYISFEPRYSELRAGGDWSAALPDATLRDVRVNLLNPALRNGDATGGVVAALAALDERARLGPFGLRRDYAPLALWIFIVIGLFVLVIGPRSFVDWLRWSRPGQWCHSVMADLWARTPPGRAQVQRRFAAQLDLARQRVQAAASQARATRLAIKLVPDDLQARLDRAEHTYTELEQRAPDQALPAVLGALSGEYRQLHEDLAAFDRKLKQQSAGLLSQAAQAHERIARVQTSFKRAATPSRRAKKNRRAISAGGQQQLSKLQARQAQLDQQRAAFDPAGLSLAERQDRLAQLTRDYAALFAEATALWQAECPRDYSAALSPQRASAYDSSSSYSSSSSYDSSHSSPTSTSSSSDYTSDWSSSSSSEPSSDGGTW